MKKAKNFIFYILSLLICLNVLAWLVVSDLQKAHFLEVNFFDIGQGDAIFITSPQRHQILIDGGPSSVILEKLAKEMPFYDRSIDLIILTHPEKDHLAGLIEVLKKYRVENILWTGVVRDTSEYKEWLGSIQKEKANIFIAKTGQKVACEKRDLASPFGLRSGMRMRPCEFSLEVLFPLENLEGQTFKDSNNTSIVAKLVFGKNSFLFTGDIYKSVEKELIAKEIDVDSDVLKVSHHGSKTSTAEEFIKEVSPEIALIQVAKDNPYGHPHLETLATLEKYGIKLLRTDEDGHIKIISDGTILRITNQN